MDTPETIAARMWERTHDGSWPDDAEPETAKIYREDAAVALAALQPRLVELETEMARLAQDRDVYKAWCDAETHHIATVRRERAEAAAALAAVQPLIEAARDLVEAHDKIRTDATERLDTLWAVFTHFPQNRVDTGSSLRAALSSFPAAPSGPERAAQPSAEERHCPDHPLNTTSDGAGTLFCATFGCSWRLPVATPADGAAHG